MLEGSLNIAVDRLTEEIGIKVLDKYKLENNDSITVDGGAKLFYNIFNIFRRGN